MLATNALAPNTRVWTASFGNEWKPASQTHLAPRQTGPVPPPIPAAAMGAIQQPPQLGRPPQGVYVPPYQPPTDAYAYLLAFIPLPMLLIDLVIYGANEGLSSEGVARISPGLGFWLGILFSSLDARNLYRSGRNPQHRTMVPFVLLTPTGYFWRRHIIVGNSVKFVFIWIACALAWMVGVGGMME